MGRLITTNENISKETSIMKNTIRYALHKLKTDFGGVGIFSNPGLFKNALDDVKIHAQERKIRYLLNMAIRDMQSFSRMQSELFNNPFITDTLILEMSSDYLVGGDIAKIVIGCIAEMLEDAPIDRTNDSFPFVDRSAANKYSTREKSMDNKNSGGEPSDDEADIALATGATQNDRQLLLQAVKGCADAQCALGDIYADEYNPNFDPMIAMKWYQKAAEGGHSKAQWLVGAGYLNGVGVEQDNDKAEYWLMKSAVQDFADGQYGLAGYYFAKQDYEHAAKFLKKAANQGHTDAITMLEMGAPLFKRL